MGVKKWWELCREVSRCALSRACSQHLFWVKVGQCKIACLCIEISRAHPGRAVTALMSCSSLLGDAAVTPVVDAKVDAINY